MENKKNERDFKGIWIPAYIWLNQDLTIMEKMFLVEIDSLDNEKHCFASNSYFSNFFNLSKGRCSEIISSLVNKKLLEIEFIYKGKVIEKRVLKINIEVFGKSVGGIRKIRKIIIHLIIQIIKLYLKI